MLYLRLTDRLACRQAERDRIRQTSLGRTPVFARACGPQPKSGRQRELMPGRPGRLCGGLYHVELHPAVPQCTRRCPLPGSASAAEQSHGAQPMITRPGPHACPAWHVRE